MCCFAALVAILQTVMSAVADKGVMPQAHLFVLKHDLSSAGRCSPPRACGCQACRCCLQGYAFVPEGDEEALMETVFSRGPLAVSLDAGHPSFRFYSHGEFCSSRVKYCVPSAVLPQ